MLATQFQHTDARKAFPVLDEPSMRAEFTLSIERQTHMEALANAHLIETEDMELVIYCFNAFENLI